MTFADMDSRIAKKSGLPAWISAYNFLSLLNLPAVVRKYGPIRNLWEGSWVGEGILRFIKPTMIHGFRKNWAVATMKSLMRKKGVQYLVGSMNDAKDHELNNETLIPMAQQSKAFHCYNDIGLVDDVLHQGDGATSTIVVGQRLVVVCERLSERRFILLTRVALESTKMGFHYFTWQRQLSEADPFHEQLLVAEDIQEVCLLLPKLPLLNNGRANCARGAFAVIDRSHRSMARDGTLRR